MKVAEGIEILSDKDNGLNIYCNMCDEFPPEINFKWGEKAVVVECKDCGEEEVILSDEEHASW